MGLAGGGRVDGGPVRARSCERLPARLAWGLPGGAVRGRLGSVARLGGRPGLADYCPRDGRRDDLRHTRPCWRSIKLMKRIFPHRRGLPMLLLCCWACTFHASAAEPPALPAETAAAQRRHERVAERRKGVDIICHRGASEHAHENTLEAFRATFELGGDGNEFDIRRTKDGVLVVFHDDMLDRLLEAHGDVSDYSWEELQRFRFRDPGRFGAQCRIPTLVEVFELHRKYGGLMHLDIKRSGLDVAIGDLLTRMDLWDQVGYCNTETGGVILR